MVPAQSHKLNNVSSNLTPATKFASLAQLVEPLTCNEKVAGSSPARGSNLNGLILKWFDFNGLIKFSYKI